MPMDRPTGRSVASELEALSRPDPAEQSRSRRERILDAAFHAFATRGYRDTAVDDIAGAAETSKGGIYFHFPNKESIFRELMETTADKLVARVERGGRAGDGARRARRGGDPHGAHDLRRPPDDGAPAVPRHDGRRSRVPGRDQRPARALRPADPGLPRRSRRGGGDPADRHRGSRASPGSAPSTRSSRAGSSPTTPGRLEDAYPALRAILLRSVGVGEARIAAVPLPAIADGALSRSRSR